MKELAPPQAWELLENRPEATLLDVRSTVEYEYVGHPIGAVHVPIKDSPYWELNPQFASDVRTALRSKAEKFGSLEKLPILSICRSGKRSALAAELLEKDGFQEVYNVIEGFEGDRDGKDHRNTINGWRFHNLPWEQS